MLTRTSLMKGLSFGLTSGVITTLGMMVALHSGTHSKRVVLGGILAIAIADAFSDAVGIHVSEEAENQHSTREIWGSTLCTFACKFVFALTFVLPVVFLPLSTAIIASVGWGLLLIVAISFYLAKQQGEGPYKAVLEHFIIAIVVITATHYVGDWIATWQE